MLLKVTIDPTGHFKESGALEERLVPACGYLIGWACHYAAELIPEARSLQTAMELQYRMPLNEMTGGEVGRDDVYRYPEDPDLYPLAKVVTGDESILIYQYAIVAFNNGYVTRMD